MVHINKKQMDRRKCMEEFERQIKTMVLDIISCDKGKCNDDEYTEQ